jgi:Ser/Thr protein kinase RdoA (MazF antagonist)
MSRIYEGCGTRNWCLHAAEGWFFIKEYPGQINVDEERQALDLAMYARDCGIPTPRVIATRSEDLICTSGDTTFVLFEWADGCTAKRSLSLEQMAQAGRVLGDMHRLPNVMFRDDRVSAVVDFQPPRPFLIAYEVGRIAFGPENFTSSGWMEKASVLIRAYCRAHRVAVHDICFAPHIWLLQLIRSMYGVKQHYTRPVELQDALDRFWFQRAHAAHTLFANLGTAQEILRSVWETSAGDGRTR